MLLVKPYYFLFFSTILPSKQHKQKQIFFTDNYHMYGGYLRLQY